jgi:hypothetical protein
MCYSIPRFLESIPCPVARRVLKYVHTPPETYLVSPSPTPFLWKFEIPAHGSIAGSSSWTEKDYVMAGHCCHAAEICAEEKNKLAE